MLTGEGQPQKAVLDVTYMWVFWSEHYKVTAAVTDDGELKTHTIILPAIFIQSKKKHRIEKHSYPDIKLAPI